MKKIISKILLATMALSLMVPSFAGAAALEDVSVALSNHTVETATSIEINFTVPSALTDTDSLSLVWPTEFTLTGAPNAQSDVDFEVEGTDFDISVQGQSNLDIAMTGAGTLAEPLLFSLDNGASIDAGETVTIKTGVNATHQGTGVNVFETPDTAGSYSFDLATSAGDTGSAAVAITDPEFIDVNAEVVPFITLVLTGPTITLDDIDASSTVSSDDTSFEVDTNADDGYTVYADSGDLTHANTVDTINAYSAGSSSAIGTEGWGFNTHDNASPNVGAVATGTGATATSGGTVDQFTAQDNSVIASANDASADHVYTLSAVANASALTKAGAYTGTIQLRTVAQF
jgi:hypothetical protein